MTNTKNKFNLDWSIPENRLVTIYGQDGKDICPVPLIMDDDFTLKLHSNFGQIWEAPPSDFLNLLSGAVGIPNGQFSLQGAQIWKSTDPIGISVKVNIEMDTDPYTDVILPILNLSEICLPTKKESTDYKAGQWVAEEVNLKIDTLIPPGPNVSQLVQEMKANPNADSLFDKIGQKVGVEGGKGVYSVKLGFLTLHKVIITGLDPKFSKTYCMSMIKANKMFPCRAELNIDMTTMEIATTDMISTIIQSF